MAGTTIEKVTCESCGVDVRENTNFCYSCGHSFAAPAIHESIGSEPIPMPDNTKLALEDFAKKMSAEDPEAEKRAQAALERKKARVVPKKPKEVVWEDAERSSGWLFFISLVIFVMVAVVVFFTVYWK